MCVRERERERESVCVCVCRHTDQRWVNYASLHVTDAQQGNLEAPPMTELESAPLAPPVALKPLPHHQIMNQ